jgi:replicative DNA helicase
VSGPKKAELRVVHSAPVVRGTPPPNDLDSEAVVLSDVLNHPESFPAIRGILSAEDFYSDANRLLFEAFCALDDADEGIDAATAAAWLRARRKFKAFGGAPYLAELLDATPAVANVLEHAEIVERLGRVRRLIAICQVCAAEGYGDVGEDVQAWLESCETRVVAISKSGHRRTDTTLEESLHVAMGEVHRSTERARITGVSTGLDSLDALTSGLQATECYLLTGVAGGGDLYERQGVAVFSGEMPHEQLSLRASCAAASVDFGKYRKGTISQVDYSKLVAASEWLRRLPLRIDDGKRLSPVTIRGRLETFRDDFAKDGVDLALAIVDYLQLLDGWGLVGPRASREEMIDATTLYLVEMAAQLKIPILLLAQLNDDGRVRYSRAAEMHAHNWIDIRRENKVVKYWQEGAESVALEVRKQRNGPPGTAACWWHGPFLLFSDEDRI